MVLGIILRYDRVSPFFLEGFETKADLASFGVHLENFDPDLLVDLDDIGGVGNAVATEFGDMNQPFNSLLEFHEGAEIRQLHDAAFDIFSNMILRGYTFPGIGGHLLDT